MVLFFLGMKELLPVFESIELGLLLVCLFFFETRTFRFGVVYSLSASIIFSGESEVESSLAVDLLSGWSSAIFVYDLTIYGIAIGL